MTRRADFCRHVWPDMGVLYGAPGIGAVCLALQAEFDVDVPFLLFMALADAAGEGMDRSSRERLQAAASEWRALSVVPLRALRRALKELAATPAEEAFRQAIKAAELDAERLEVAKLAALFAALSGPSGLAEAYLTDLGVPSIRKEVALAAIRRALAAPDSSAPERIEDSMADFDRVIIGTLVTEEGVSERSYVAVSGEKIAAVGSGPPPAARETLDFGDAYVMPGTIDGQVHSRSQAGQEDFVWSTRAAAAGGVTTIVDMPYDDGNLICTPELLTAKAESAAAQARVDFALYGTIHPADGVVHIPAMAEAGAIGFKFSTFETHPDRFPRIATPLLYQAFSEVAKTGLIAGVHNENDECVRAWSKAVTESGVTDWRAHSASRPAISEMLAIAEVYEIGAATGCRSHIVHCSVGRGYELAQAYRGQDVEATIEACIHYLVCAEEEDVSRLLGRAKCNPPIRGRREREVIWAHLAAGHVTLVSTDHVSWSLSRKSSPVMLENASGMPSLEVLTSLLVDGLVERNLPLTHAARLLAGNPARLFRISDRKGALAVGLDADIAVLAERPRHYDPSESGHNFVQWSPYEGRLIRHRPIATFQRGRMIYDGTTVLAEPGAGQFVKATRPFEPSVSGRKS